MLLHITRYKAIFVFIYNSVKPFGWGRAVMPQGNAMQLFPAVLTQHSADEFLGALHGTLHGPAQPHCVTPQHRGDAIPPLPPPQSELQGPHTSHIIR